MQAQKTEKMNAMATLCMMLESGISPMSGVGLDLYKIPTGYDGDFLYDLHRALLKTDVASIGETNALFVATLPYPSGVRQCLIAAEAAANYYKYANCSHIDH